jgi:hypothetical protein
VLAGLALLATGSSIWFILIQAFILRRFCIWCMVDHAAGIAAAVLLLRALWPDVQSQYALPLMIAIVPLAILILGQLLIEPKTFEVQRAEEVTCAPAPAEPQEPTARDTPPHAPAPTPQPAVTRAPASPPPSPPPAAAPPVAAPAPPRMLALLEGRLKISTAAFPLLGPADAAHVLIDMLDYTCEHCRELHHWLTQARPHFNNQLAVLAIPLPMESTCNPLIQFTNPKHANACTYTRYALAVWHADRASFHEYHDWLYAPPRPPHLAEARGRAEQLVGPQAFAAALASPAVNTSIQNAIGVYKFLGRGQIPKLVMNRGVLVGQVRSLQRLIQVLEEDFNPPKAAPPAEITTTFIGGFK